MWKATENNYYRYPYCWFLDLTGCQDDPALSLATMPGENAGAVPPPLRLEISLGNFHYDFNLQNFVHVTVAACTGLLTAAFFTFIVRNEFCLRAFKSAVATVGTSVMNFASSLDVRNNKVPDTDTEETGSEPEIKVTLKPRKRKSSRSRSRVSFGSSTRVPDRSTQAHAPAPTPAAPSNANGGYRINTRVPSVKVLHRGSELVPSTTSIRATATSQITPSSPPPRKNCMLELHQYPRGKSVPCENPWGMRLECLLRILKIPYTAICDCSPTQLPWFIYRDFDKQFQSTSKPTEGNFPSVVESLCNNFPESRAHLVNQKKEVPSHFLTSLVEYHLIPTLKKVLEVSEGLALIGHQNQTVLDDRDQFDGISGNDGVDLKTALFDDLVSLSAALSEKAYFLGEKISEVDCIIFAALAPMVWTNSGLFLQQLVYRHSNLVNFCLRMKFELWPDWNSNIEQSLPALQSPPSPSPCYFTQSESEADEVCNEPWTWNTRLDSGRSGNPNPSLNSPNLRNLYFSSEHFDPNSNSNNS